MNLPISISIPSFTLTCAAAALLAGCASPRVDVQWRDPQLPASYLRGAKVFVVCEAYDLAVKRICEDRVVADLNARGVNTVTSEPGLDPGAPRPGVADAQWLPTARGASAKAVFGVSVGVASQAVSPGFSVGIGGFGIGRHSAGGVGVSAPIGGGDVTQGYAASARITDAASGRLMWTARASTPPSGDVNAQIADLAKTLGDATAEAGLY